MELIFSNEWLQLFKAENEVGDSYQFTKDCDKVVILPYYIINGKPNIITLIEPIKLWGRKKEVTCVTGSLEVDEDPKACAVRELLEETGVSCEWGNNWDYVGKFNHNKGSVDKRHLFLVDVTGKEIQKKKTDGSWFEKNTTTTISGFEILDLSTDIFLHLLSQKLKEKMDANKGSTEDI